MLAQREKEWQEQLQAQIAEIEQSSRAEQVRQCRPGPTIRDCGLNLCIRTHVYVVSYNLGGNAGASEPYGCRDGNGRY